MSTPPEGPPREGGNILTQRIGPVATWVWLLGLTVLILIYAFVKKGKTPAAQTTGQAAAGTTTSAQNVPDIIINNQQAPEEAEPPAGAVPPGPPGPAGPPGAPGAPGKPGTPAPPPGKPPVKPPVKPPPPPKKPPAQKYETVTVARWTAKNTPWNSTLWGIATHYGVKGGYEALAKLNGIKNPNLIHPGQKIKVPV